jgi:hypothetical protein
MRCGWIYEGRAGAILGPCQNIQDSILKNSVKNTIPCKSYFLSGRGSDIWLKKLSIVIRDFFTFKAN